MSHCSRLFTVRSGRTTGKGGVSVSHYIVPLAYVMSYYFVLYTVPMYLLSVSFVALFSYALMPLPYYCSSIISTVFVKCDVFGLRYILMPNLKPIVNTVSISISLSLSIFSMQV